MLNGCCCQHAESKLVESTMDPPTNPNSTKLIEVDDAPTGSISALREPSSPKKETKQVDLSDIKLEEKPTPTSSRTPSEQMPPAPAPAPPKDSSLVEMVFQVDGKPVVKEFTKKKALGMKFTNSAPPSEFNTIPILISQVTPGSQADDIGVKEGWQLTKLGGREMKNMTFEELKAFCKDQTPLKIMYMEFNVAGQKVVKAFTRRPLGMKFTNNAPPDNFASLPLVVSSVTPGSHSAELGVKLNWEIKKIADRDITTMTLDQMKDFCKEQCANLPKGGEN